jgi:hypothetical protein
VQQPIPGSSTKGPAEMFTGDGYFDVIVKSEEPSRVRVNTVCRGDASRSWLDVETTES